MNTPPMDWDEEDQELLDESMADMVDFERRLQGEEQRGAQDYSENDLEKLAAEYQDFLIDMIERGRLRPSILTFAAEAVGKIELPRANRALLGLLHHPSPLVREGAIYGLSRQMDWADTRPALRLLATSDPSLAVREAAAETLDESKGDS